MPSTSVSGSPPLRITSWIESSAAMLVKAGTTARPTWDWRCRGSGDGSSSGNGQRSAGCYHQDREAYFWSSPGLTAAARIPNRIGRIARHGGLLFVERQHLPQERVVRIAWPHPRDVAKRCEQRKAGGGSLGAGHQFERQIEQPAQLGWVADRGSQGLLPVGRLGHRPVGLGNPSIQS